MSLFVTLSFLSLCLVGTYAQNEDAFEVTEPKAGDTVTTSRYTTDGVVVPIKWTVPSTLADKPVIISLVQGDDLSSLSTISQINASAPNTGSYTWRGDEFDSALVFGYGYGIPSGCNYSIGLKAWTDVVYSDYFTIISPNDGGLAAGAKCPEGDAATGPRNQTFTTGTSNSQSSEQASGTSTRASSSSPTNTGSSDGQAKDESSGQNSGTTTGASSNTSAASNAGNRSSGVSTTTLAVAVAVPIVVLLLAFGGIIWFGIQRGWFVKKAPLDGSTVEKSDGTNTKHGGVSGNKPTGGNGEVRELHSDHRPHQLDYSPVHELQGSEEDRRGYVVRN